MVNLIVHKVLIFFAILAFANSAPKCSRSLEDITCENADKGVIKRLMIYYKNDVSLTVKNSSISILDNGIFDDLKRVEKLRLINCGIQIIEDGSFRGLNLTHLNLARNLIKNISKNVFANLTDLKFLDLSHNFISQFELNSGGVNHLPKLSHIDVSNNRLTSFTIVGIFAHLKTINFENNHLKEFGSSEVLRFPKIKEVFFAGNSFNKSYESFLMFIFTCADIKIYPDENQFMDKNIIPNMNSSISLNHSMNSIKYDIEKEFKLSPELIKSLNYSQLKNLVDRITILRNFTLNERKVLEMDRKRIREESRSIKKESNRIQQILKRFNEVTGLANEETIDEYIEKSCGKLPENTWWRRFKKWSCKKLYKWVKKIISR